MADLGFAFSWDSNIEKDDQFITLEEGDYRFTVKSFERGQYNGSEKLPPCPEAKMTLEVTGEDGTVTITESLKLCSKMEWLLSAFFRSVGMKKKGEPLKMDFPGSIGKSGWAHITKQADRNDSSKFYNHVGRFIDPDQAPKQAPSASNTFAQPQQSYQQASFNFGGFGR